MAELKRLKRIGDISLGAFLLSLLLTVPYGLFVVSESAIRVPDVFATSAIIVLLTIIVTQREIHIPWLAAAVLGPFLFLELTLPIIGAVLWGGISDALGPLRFALLYGPVILFGIAYSPNEIFDRLDGIDHILGVVIAINVILATLHLFIVQGMLPWSVLPATHLESFAVDPHFDAYKGRRPAGSFKNSTGLSVFGIITLAFYLSRLHVDVRRDWLILAGSGLYLTLISTSRVAIAGAAGMISVWILLQPQKISIAAVGIAAIVGGISVGLVSMTTRGFNHRFVQFFQNPFKDNSFSVRYETYWPRAMEAVESYPVGTLIRPTQIVGTIDSGYLTYWVQGTYIFIMAVVVLFVGASFIAASGILRAEKNWPALFLALLLVYLLPAMIFSIPTRRPSMIVAFTFSLTISTIANESTEIHSLS